MSVRAMAAVGDDCAGAEPSQQFAIIYRTWFSLGLSHREFVVGAAIMLHYDPKNPDKCFPSIARLGELTGVQHRHVRECVRELERRGAIEVTRTPGLPNRYRPRTAAVPGPLQTPVTAIDPTPRSAAVLEPGSAAVRLSDQLSDQISNHSPVSDLKSIEARASEMLEVLGELIAPHVATMTRDGWRKMNEPAAIDMVKAGVSASDAAAFWRSDTERRGAGAILFLSRLQSEMATAAVGIRTANGTLRVPEVRRRVQTPANIH